MPINIYLSQQSIYFTELMIKSWLIIFFFVLLLPAAYAQYEAWPGTWLMQYSAPGDTVSVSMQLKIGNSEKGILYPACIQLNSGGFSGTYELLLVKKNSRQLAISRNKYAVSEKPFSLEDGMLQLNGMLDLSRDLKGLPVLTLNRMLLKQNMVSIKDSLPYDQRVADRLLHFLKSTDIFFNRVDGIPWSDSLGERVLSPTYSPVYYGLLDTIYIPSRDAAVHFSSQNKNDIVSLAANGRMLYEQLYLSKRDYADDILLDTGVNIVVLFAENFNEEMPNKGKVNFEFGRKKFKFDFARRDDSAAVFIAAKLYFEHDKDKDTHFSDYKTNERVRANEKLIGSVKTQSKQITLALWDDAVEDGDSVSISINNKWIARGFPVKKNVQFLTVTVEPGPNTIMFIGDNLGSIPPNTSVLEIIDGKRRKSFLLETVPGETNLLKIFYDLK